MLREPLLGDYVALCAWIMYSWLNGSSIDYFRKLCRAQQFQTWEDTNILSPWRRQSMCQWLSRGAGKMCHFRQYRQDNDMQSAGTAQRSDAVQPDRCSRSACGATRFPLENKKRSRKNKTG